MIAEHVYRVAGRVGGEKGGRYRSNERQWTVPELEEAGGPETMGWVLGHRGLALPLRKRLFVICMESYAVSFNLFHSYLRKVLYMLDGQGYYCF